MAYPYYKAVAACAKWIAESIIENARDNDDDPTSYSTDEEVVNLYLRNMASDISEALPKAVLASLGEDEINFDDDGDGMTDSEADADVLASAGWGTDEDYGDYGGGYDD